MQNTGAKFSEATRTTVFVLNTRRLTLALMPKERGLAIKDLYPHLNDEQLKEAEQNLDEYLEIVLRIYDRILSDPKAYRRFKSLTAARKDHYDIERKVEPT